MQKDLFNSDEVEELRQECAQLRQAQANMRRGLFSRHNELERIVRQLQEEIQQLKQISAKKKAELVPFFGEYIELTK